MSELALQLIEKEKQERTGKLDLGKYGLSDIPGEVFELTWLQELSFCNEKYDYEKDKWQESSNTRYWHICADYRLGAYQSRLRLHPT